MTDLGCATPLADGSCVPVHALAYDSPALDAGSCAISGTSLDARGFARPYDFTGAANADDGCDAGAFELYATTDLGLALGADSFDAVPGQETTLTITITNGGPTGSTGGVAVTDLPVGLTYVNSFACGHDSSTVTCAVPALEPGETYMTEVTALVDLELDDGVALTVEATVTANETDPDASDDTHTVTLVVGTPLFADGFESGSTSAWSLSTP